MRELTSTELLCVDGGETGGTISVEYGGVSDFLCVRRFSPEVSFSEPA